MSMQLPFILFDRETPVEGRKIVFSTEDNRFCFGEYIDKCCYSDDERLPSFKGNAIAWVYWSAVESVLSAHMGGE